MPIKNYTTSIPAERTVTEVQKMLARRGSQRMEIGWNAAGYPVALSFTIVHEDRGEWYYRLPVRWEGVLATLRADGVAKKYVTDEHALRVAWRIVRDWLDAQLALIDAGAAEIGEVMLPYLIMPGGETCYRWMLDQADERRLLGAGEAIDYEEEGS